MSVDTEVQLPLSLVSIVRYCKLLCMYSDQDRKPSCYLVGAVQTGSREEHLVTVCLADGPRGREGVCRNTHFLEAEDINAEAEVGQQHVVQPAW